MMNENIRNKKKLRGKKNGYKIFSSGSGLPRYLPYRLPVLTYAAVFSVFVARLSSDVKLKLKIFIQNLT